MFRRRSVIMTLVVTFLLLALLPAGATEVGDRLEDGIVVEQDAGYCGCCHEHNHQGGFAKISCFFCKITQFFKNLFGKAEENPEHKYCITATKEATCTAAGYESFRCLVCDKTLTKSYDKLAHTPVALQAVEASCTESGLTQGSKCSVCNTVLVRQTVVPANGHSYDDGVVTTAPTCEAEGVKTFTCADCGGTKTESIAATGHDWEDEILEEATCEKDGAMARVCKLCEATVDREIIPATGHSYDVGKQTTAPGCESEGVMTFTCGACGDAYTESIPATGHSYDDGKQTTAPGCEAEGVMTFTCGACGDAYTQPIPATGHSYGDGVETLAPTCTEEGVRTFTCGDCGIFYTETIEALGHVIPINATLTGFAYNDPSSAGYLRLSFACGRCSNSEGYPYFTVDYTEYKAVIKNTAGVVFYATVEEALKASKSGDTVIVGVDDTIQSDVTVPAGVMLLVPCDNALSGYAASGFCLDNASKTGTATLYRTLTVAEGATLTVNGKVFINAVTGRAGSASVEPYGNSGNYGQICLYGDIVVKNGGIFDCAGFVTDAGGNMLLESGAVMYETYAVEKFRGGTYVSNHANFSPILERQMNNMQASLRIEAGASVIGSVKMHANDMYYYTYFPQIDNTNGIIRLENGAYILREIDTVNERDIYSFYGDVVFSSSALNVAGYDLATDTANFYLFDGDTTFNFYAGNGRITKSFAFLPGGVVNLYDGANLTFSGYAGFAMFDQGYYTAEEGLWSEAHKYTKGRPNAELNMYAGSVINATGNRSELVGVVNKATGAVLNTASNTKTSITFTVPTGMNTASLYCDYVLDLQLNEE